MSLRIVAMPELWEPGLVAQSAHGSPSSETSSSKSLSWCESTLSVDRENCAPGAPGRVPRRVTVLGTTTSPHLSLSAEDPGLREHVVSDLQPAAARTFYITQGLAQQPAP